MAIVTGWGATGAGDGVVNKVPEKQKEHSNNYSKSSIIFS